MHASTAVELENFPRILWKYGQTLEALCYAVGREKSLPCNKRRVRQYLLMAINLAGDANARERLCTGYVNLEVFIADAEFEIVKELQDTPGEKAYLLRTGFSPQAFKQMAARAAAADPGAFSILMRIAEQMLARQRELWADH